MTKYLAFFFLGLTIVAGGCASSNQAHSPATDSNSSASAQPDAQPTTSQDREDRIKQGDAVRKAMGY
jgi:hypothetical protein